MDGGRGMTKTEVSGGTGLAEEGREVREFKGASRRLSIREEEVGEYTVRVVSGAFKSEVENERCEEAKDEIG
ncbi:hypothetical protein E2C01_099594 [Portunus trituberculatus]|uniref:Uncharacterized protein n=1 Tax=Portunus trituberculatus TaxID=210409 RepID=A0A5B7KH83_PORTR|nr:hypothetical protein [Portunus trituberculatus]